MFIDRRAMVIETRGNRVTVMTRDGRFMTIKAPTPALLPGETIMLPESSYQRFSLRRAAFALALSSMLILLSFFGYQNYLYARPTIAYITLDSAASIEFVINDRGLVKSAKAYDKTGEEILKKISYEMKPVQEVAKSVAEAEHDISKNTSSDTEVLVGIVPIKETPKLDKIQKRIEAEVSKALQTKSKSHKSKDPNENASASKFKVTSVRLDKDIRDAAEKIGVSAARAAIWAITKSIDVLPVDDFGDSLVPTDNDDVSNPSIPPIPEEEDHEGKELDDEKDKQSSENKPGKGENKNPGKSQDLPQEQQDKRPGTSNGNEDKSRNHILTEIRQSLPKADWSELLKNKEDISSLKDLTKGLLEHLIESTDSQSKNNKDGNQKNGSGQKETQNNSNNNQKANKDKNEDRDDKSPNNKGAKESPKESNSKNNSSKNKDRNQGNNNDNSGNKQSNNSKSNNDTPKNVRDDNKSDDRSTEKGRQDQTGQYPNIPDWLRRKFSDFTWDFEW